MSVNVEVPSVVPKVSGDPRTLAYFTPSISPTLIAKKFQRYYATRTLQILDQVAKATGKILVPSSCVHWRKRIEIPYELRFQVGKRVYFLMDRDEVTPKTLEKMELYVEENYN